MGAVEWCRLLLKSQVRPVRLEPEERQARRADLRPVPSDAAKV
jgi:hypothetical protein